MTMDPTFSSLLDAIGRPRPVDPQMEDAARYRHDRLTKPPGSLGRLEVLAAKMAGIQRSLRPRALPGRCIVFAGDHGVTARGVSPFPASVTASMVANFVRGGAAINALTRAGSIELEVVDVGVASPIPDVSDVSDGRAAWLDRRVVAGTRDFTVEPAMTPEQCAAAIRVGVQRADEAADDGVAVVGLGEMGIGNTTVASALTVALLDRAPSLVVGPGTGADAAMQQRKIEVVNAGLSLHAASLGDPFELLRRLGGLEIAALVGVCLGAAARGVAVMLDGFITTAAARLAVELEPECRPFMFAAHRSAEPGHRHLLDDLGLDPILELDMRLGEGSGAAVAMPILEAACAVLRDMATFDEAAVAGASGS